MRNLAIGIDIGGTNTKFGLADRDGNVFENSRIKTTGHADFDAYFAALVEAIRERIDKLEGDVNLVGIGVGAPNSNFYTGTIENAANLPWKHRIPLAEILAEEFGIECVITNDANAAAIGEMVYGGAKEMKDFLVITLGTGLGGGIISNGKIINGHDGYAGELGHITVNYGGRQCGCGRKGCLETYVSATGIRRTVYKLLADHTEESELRGIAFNELSTETISEAAEKGDIVAKAAFEYTGKVLGRALANSVAHTSPEAIFIFGGLAKAGELILEPTKLHMEKNLLSFYQNKVKVLPSGLGDENAPILGASSLIWNYLEESQ